MDGGEYHHMGFYPTPWTIAPPHVYPDQDEFAWVVYVVLYTLLRHNVDLLYRLTIPQSKT